MKALGTAVLCLMLGACEVEAPSEDRQQEPKTTSELGKSEEIAGSSQTDSASAPKRQELPLWQSVALMVGTSEAAAETLITSVLAKHDTVASEQNVRDLVGALLRFRDQDNVSPKSVLTCMDSGVRSPTGPFWQDTIAYCVTELAE